MWQFGIYVKNKSENSAKTKSFGQFSSFTLCPCCIHPSAHLFTTDLAVVNKQQPGICKQICKQITCALLHATGGEKRRNRWRMKKREEAKGWEQGFSEKDYIPL